MRYLARIFIYVEAIQFFESLYLSRPVYRNLHFYA
jgi:hypothetical protein